MRFPALILLAALSVQANAQTRSWRIGDDQPFPTPFARLSLTRQEAIVAGLKKTSLEARELAGIRKDLLVKTISTPAGSMLLVQGSEIELCGGTGNCALWAFDSSNQVILASVAYRVSLLPTEHRGRPDIRVGTHSSAFASNVAWYRFDGHRYRAYSCAYETFSDVHGVFKHPHYDFGPCEKPE